MIKNIDDYEVVLVCARKGPTPYSDNEHGLCDGCGRDVMWRPQNLKGRVAHICEMCAIGEMEIATAKGEDVVQCVTFETAKDMLTEYGVSAKQLERMFGVKVMGEDE